MTQIGGMMLPGRCIITTSAATLRARPFGWHRRVEHQHGMMPLHARTDEQRERREGRQH
jgi:hypothetical protein